MDNMGHASYGQISTRPGIDRLRKLAHLIKRDIGTPFYAYDEPSLVESIRFFLFSADEAGIGDRLRLYLPMFALPNLTLLQRLVQLDARVGLACNTPEEVYSLQSFSWTDWHRVVFSGGVLPAAALGTIAALGCLIHAASVGNLSVLANAPEPYRIGLRLDLSNAALKGLRDTERATSLEVLRRHAKRLVGLHAYPGTEIRNERRLVSHARALVSIAAEIPGIEELNFGGGFGYDYESETGGLDSLAWLSSYLHQVKNLLVETALPSEPVLAWEPGRILFARSGFFVTEVIEVRQTSPTMADVYVDGSFANLPALKIRGRQHKVLILTPGGEVRGEEGYDSRICGATTLSSDVLLPGPVPLTETHPGDLLVIVDVGAYGRAGAYNFLGKALPPEVLIDDIGWYIIRHCQRLDHLADKNEDHGIRTNNGPAPVPGCKGV